MLNSVFGTDLYLFMLSLEGVVPLQSGFVGVDGAGRSAVADGSMASQLRLVLLLAGAGGRPFADTAGDATLQGMAARIFSALSEASRAASRPGTAPPPAKAVTPADVWSVVRQAVGNIPRVVSLWALAAIALPGLAGLVVLTLAGVGVGYRQAKASFVMRATGIARFAGPGPLGVVRSGSSVLVRPRRLRVVPSRPSSGGSLTKIA